VCVCALLLTAACQETTPRDRVLNRLPDPLMSFGPPMVRREYVPAPMPVAPPTPKRPTFAGDVPANWYVGRPRAWKVIVVHHSAGERGSASVFDRDHRARGWDELGYHFVIGNGSNSPDGAIEVGSRWRKQKHGAHCKTPDNYYNDNGIGICLVGNMDNHPPTPRQLAALRKLTLFLSMQYNVPESQIIGHGDAPGTSTRCPGRMMGVRQLASWVGTHRDVYATSR
jgi:hypothetical protein